MEFKDLDDTIRRAIGTQPGTAKTLARIYNQLKVVNPEAHAAWVRYDMEALASGKHALHHVYSGANIVDAGAEQDAYEEQQRLQDLIPDEGEELHALADIRDGRFRS